MSASDFDDRQAMQALLTDWAARQWLRPLDTAFAEFLWREIAGAPPFLILAAALASHQLGRGHACLDLAATLAEPEFALSLPPEGGYSRADGVAAALAHPAAVFAGLSLERWQQALAQPLLVGAGAGNTPLVLAGTRLYLRRYWQYEQDVRTAIGRRLALSAGWQPTLPVAALRRTLAALFAAPADGGSDWQKIACALAARSGFSIITGGPGTGKTTTVVRLLALLQALVLAAPDGGEAAPRPWRIRLAAPTGKAAARLNEAIASAVAGLPLDVLENGEAVRAAIPLKVSTLHRLLGSRPDARRFRHHAGNPLALDVLVIDEASMVDLEMMAALLAALPAPARLILLGDKDQLASVEAGAVLGELCRRARDGHYTPATADWLERASGERIAAELLDEGGSPLDQAVVMLRRSHRFAAGSGIGQLAEAVNAGDTACLERICGQGCADLALVPLPAGDRKAFEGLVVDGRLPLAAAPAATPSSGYRHCLETLQRLKPACDAGDAAFDDWARAVLQAHARFQVLCALRRGPWGVAGLNQRIARALHDAGLIATGDGWYVGRPVLVTRNDYGLGLMNGDIGITLARPAAGDGEWLLRVAFPAGDAGQGVRWVLPSRLQAVETAYALTVHKAQGSEFAHAALVLPEAPSPILTRELLYTGITRARSFLTIANPGPATLLAAAVRRQVLRASGLAVD